MIPKWNYRSGRAISSGRWLATSTALALLVLLLLFSSGATSALAYSHQSPVHVPVMPATNVKPGKVPGRTSPHNGVKSTTGDLLWGYHTNGDMRSSPTVADGVVYIGTDLFDNASGNGCLYALNATSGTLLWSYSLNGYGIGASPLVANGVVFIRNRFERDGMC